METVLIVITLVSLAMTIVFAFALVRLIRTERRRSLARVELLREMADGVVVDADAIDPSPDADFDLRSAGDAPEMANLFVRPEARSAWPRRFAVVAGIAMFVVVAALALRLRPAPITSAYLTTPTPASVPAQTPGQLELLSLKQAQGADALTITGLVQNPANGTELSKVVATALLFGADGTFLATGRAPLDFAVLRPGDESGFVIKVPVTAPVARYRIGFRNEDGHVIGHIDRRTAATVAAERGEAPARSRGTS
jgi:hypothetical protein